MLKLFRLHQGRSIVPLLVGRCNVYIRVLTLVFFVLE